MAERKDKAEAARGTKDRPAKRHASPSVAPESYATSWDDIACPRCQRQGRLKWEDGPSGRALIGIDGDFYERMYSKAPYFIELVCNGCGTALPRRVRK